MVKSYLKDTNPLAFNQLNKIWSKRGPILSDMNKDEILADLTSYLAEWVCSEGHIWISEISCRKEISNDMTCPICKNRNLNINPRLLKHYIYEHQHGNIMKSEWYCKECHQVFVLSDENIPHYDATPYHFCLCDDTPVIKISHPLLAEEWDSSNIVSADEVDEFYKNKVIWRCKACNNTWEDYIADRLYKNKSCPYCSGQYTKSGKNSLFDLYPVKMRAWSKRLNKDFDPFIYSKNSLKRVYWDCEKCGLSYSEKIRNVISSTDSLCPHCQELEITKEETDEIYSEYISSVVKEYSYNFYLNPSNKNIQEWKCYKCKQIWRASAYDRFYMKVKCPYCSNRKPLAGYNTVDIIKKELIQEYSSKNEYPLSNFLPDSAYNAIWECNVCHGEYNALIRDRDAGDDSCPYCSNRKPLAGFNTIKINNPELLPEWCYINNCLVCNPDSIMFNYQNPIWWTCISCKTNYVMSPNKKIKMMARKIPTCQKCTGRRRKKDYFF